MLGITTSAMADDGGAVLKIPVAVMNADGALLTDVTAVASQDARPHAVKATNMGMGVWEIETLATARKVTLSIEQEGMATVEAEVIFPKAPPTMVQVYLEEKAPRVEFIMPQVPVRGPTTLAEMPMGAAPADRPMTVDSTAAVAPAGWVPPVKQRQGGDTCATAAPIAALPFSGSGTTVGYTNDYDEVCTYTGSTAPDVVYSYTPTADMVVDISLCTNSAYDTKVYVYEDTCPAPDSGAYVACNDDSCNTPSYPSAYVSEVNNVSLTAGHIYYIVVDGYGTAAGSYTIDVAEHVQCVVDCPTGANVEGETCGDDTNGGCNMDFPAFEPISLGDTVCGTGWSSTSLRDTDWYEITTTNAVQFTWTVESEFPVLCGLVEMSTPGSGNCADSTGYLNPYAIGGECDEVSVVTDTLPPGTHWFFVAPSSFVDWPCDSNNDYVATLTGVEITTGACCDPNPPYDCYPDKSQADCEAIFGPGQWQGAGTDCDPNPCLPCADEIINLGDTVSGTTCGMVDDWADTCLGYYDGGEDYIYEFTLTDPALVTITMDPLGTTYTGISLSDTCPPGASCIAIDTGSSGIREIDCVPLDPGTYYIMVDTWPSPDCIPAFNLTLEECVPCVLDCPDGASQEPEPCGSDTNGGCNMAVPTFTPISCGETVCGTIWADGGTRDTDWYEVTVTEDTIFTWTAEAEFDVVIGLVETAIAGQPDCASASQLNPYAVGGDCTPISITTECLPAGDYWFFVSHQAYEGAPCSSFSDYVATLTCQTCYLPPGACCSIDGTCTEVPELNCGGVWMGEGTTCDPNPCTPMADFCEDAIPIDVPSVTPGTTLGATTDDGFPTCDSQSPTGPGVWFSVVGTGNTMTADLCNGATTYDSKLIVYCPDCAEPVCVAGNDDFCGLQSQVTWCSQYGANYLILVTGYSTASGNFELTVTDDGVPCTGAVACLPEGACCFDNAACVITNELDCTMQGGGYQGDDTTCGGLAAAEEKFVCNEHIIGALDGSSPVYDRIYGGSVDLTCNSSVYDSGVDGQYYAAVPIATTVSENLEAEFLAAGTTIGDTVMTLYCDPFDPANPSVNVVSYDDDGAGNLLSGFYASDGIFLDAGVQYWLVLSTFSGGVTGSYDVCLGGHFFVGGGGAGACCLPDGTCADNMEADACDAAGGTFMGGGSECASVTCPELRAACCLPVATIADCIVTSQTCCEYAGGDFLYGVDNCGEGVVTLVAADFNAGLPTGWTVTGGPFTWVTNDVTGRTNYAGGDGLCMDGDSDYYNSGGAAYDTSLITPEFDVLPGAMLEFDAAYNYLSTEQFEVNITTDGGMNWTNLLTWMEDHDAYGPGEHVTLDLGAFSGNMAQVAFRYVGTGWDWWVEVDNVLITGLVEGENPCPLYPRLDIKPGSCPNSFNRGSNGVLPVAVLGDADFDAMLVDISTLHIGRADGVGGIIGPNEGPPGPHTTWDDVGTPYEGELCGCHDLNGDGIMDLVMKFKTEDLVMALQMDEFDPGALVELTVGGNMLDGKEFHASDCVRLVPPGSPPGQLVITSNVPGVWIGSSPMDLQLDGGGFTDFQRNFPVGTVVTLTAPDSIAGRAFTRWVVGGVLYPTGVKTIQIPIEEGLNSVELEVKFRPPNIPPRVPGGPDRLLGS
jgi:hypothetical protein